MNALSLELTFEGHRVRMVGTDERPQWVAKDVCRALFIHNSGQALANTVPDNERGLTICDTPGGPQEMATVTEPGLYRLILRSRKPAAERFRTWMVRDVLPCLRVHGCYPPPAQRAAIPTDALSVFEAAVAALREQAERTAKLEVSVARIEARHQVAEQELRALPPSTEPAPQKDVRALVNERVRAWAAANGGAFQEGWRKLKHELLYRCHFDAEARARHSGRGWMDEVEAAGRIPTLYAIACEVLPSRREAAAAPRPLSCEAN